MKPWLQTRSGRRVDLLGPSVSQIDFGDIANALSHINRFTGHTFGRYSVAQHCCLGADYLKLTGHSALTALGFLLHDAHEAYLGDIATPIAAAVCDVSALRAAKVQIDHCIQIAAGVVIPHDIKSLIREIDLCMCRTERDALMAAPPEPWADEIENAALLPIVIKSWDPLRAHREWFARFNRLKKECR